MRTVVSKEQVVALWWSQSQPSARNASRSFFFEGEDIYSYGYHFCIASRRPGFTLLTTQTYSRTTAGHIRLVRRVLSGEVLKVATPNGFAEPNVERMNHHLENLLLSIVNPRRVRSRDRIISEYSEQVRCRDRYCELMGIEPGELALPTFDKEKLRTYFMLRALEGKSIPEPISRYLLEGRL